LVKLPLLAVLGILAAAAISLYSLSFRYRIEARNRACELIVEMDAAEALAKVEGLTLAQGLARLKESGVSAVALTTQTVGELVDEGTLDIRPGERDEVVLMGDPETIRRVAWGYGVRFEGKAPEIPADAAPVQAFVASGISASTLRDLDVGLDPHWADAARVAGMRIYGRVVNPVGASSGTVRETLRGLKELGAEVFLPQGDQVLGRRGGLESFVEELAALDMLYASPEFARIGGDANVVAKIPERTIRLHSAQAAELDKMPLGDAVERYVRAGRERNIRALLLRPISTAEEKPLTALAQFAGSVRDRLYVERAGVGTAKVFSDPGVDRWTYPAIGVAAALVALYAGTLFFTSTWIVALGILGCFALGAGAWFPELRSWTALMAAVSFPIAAFAFLERAQKPNPFIQLGAITLIAVAGGLSVAALLNGLPFMVRADQFNGVKLAHFGPIFLIGFFFATRLLDWRPALKSPMTWLQAFLGMFILVALALMFARTGNDNPAAVSGLELQLRSLLDNVLPVRPRTKEFMFGYPVLVIGLMLLRHVRLNPQSAEPLKGWVVLALMIGAIAPTSVVNTLCHLHTPLDVGLARILVGLVLGGIIGAGVWMVLRRWVPKSEAVA